MVGNLETAPATNKNDESQSAGSLLPTHQSYILCICVQLLSFPHFVKINKSFGALSGVWTASVLAR